MPINEGAITNPQVRMADNTLQDIQAITAVDSDGNASIVFSRGVTANGTSGYVITAGPTTTGGVTTHQDIHVSFDPDPSEVNQGESFESTETYFTKTTVTASSTTTEYTCQITMQATGGGTNPTTCTPTTTVPVTTAIGNTYDKTDTGAGTIFNSANMTRQRFLIGTKVPTYSGNIIYNLFNGVSSDGNDSYSNLAAGTQISYSVVLTAQSDYVFVSTGNSTLTVTGMTNVPSNGGDIEIDLTEHNILELFNAEDVTVPGNAVQVEQTGGIAISLAFTDHALSFYPVLASDALQTDPTFIDSTNSFPVIAAGGHAVNRTVVLSVSGTIPTGYYNAGQSISGIIVSVVRSQPAPPAVISDATTATISGDNPLSVGVYAFAFISVTTNGAWDIITTGAPSGWQIEPSENNNANGSIRIVGDGTGSGSFTIEVVAPGGIQALDTLTVNIS